MKSLGTYIVNDKAVTLYLTQTFIEDWYGNGKEFVDADGVKNWSGGIKRIVTNCITEETALNYIRESMKQKPRTKKEKLPEINFPE